MNILYKTSLLLSIIGSINWGLVGLFNVNLVTLLSGDTLLTTIIYTLVCIGGLISIGILMIDLDDKRKINHA